MDQDLNVLIYERLGISAQPPIFLPKQGDKHICSRRDQHSNHHAKQPCHIESGKRCCKHKYKHEKRHRSMAFIKLSASFS